MRNDYHGTHSRKKKQKFDDEPSSKMLNMYLYSY